MLWTYCEILRGYFRNVLSPANAPLWQKNKGVSKIHLDPLRWFLMTTIFFKQYIHMYIVYNGVNFSLKLNLNFYMQPQQFHEKSSNLSKSYIKFIYSENQGTNLTKLPSWFEFYLNSKRLMDCKILSYFCGLLRIYELYNNLVKLHVGIWKKNRIQFYFGPIILLLYVHYIGYMCCMVRCPEKDQWWGGSGRAQSSTWGG